MKKQSILTGFFFIMIALLFFSCEKYDGDRTPGAFYSTVNNSSVQVYISTVGASRNYVYVDGRAQNGSLLAFTSSTSASPLFPSSGYGFTVPAGQRNFLIRDTLSTSTQIPLSFANIFSIGKNYTIFTYDTITAVKQKTVETSIVVPTDTSCRVRLAHFAYSPVLMPNVDLYSFKRAGNVITNVAPTDVTNFVAFASKLNDTLQVRVTGTANVLAQLNGFLPTEKRSYTLVYRGSHRGASSARFLSSFVNY